MDTAGASAVLTQYQARPGRKVLVVTDLASLRGPAKGTVELPLWLYWSGPSPAFDLGKPFMRRWLYEIVLREGRPADILAYVDGALLLDLWADLVLPRAVRSAWAPLIEASHGMVA